MPIFEVQCGDALCAHVFEVIAKSKEALASDSCPQCGYEKLEHLLTSPGGYHIKGNNTASQRPKGAGSWKKS
jgi:putative FmdB family regulatory protein